MGLTNQLSYLSGTTLYPPGLETWILDLSGNTPLFMMPGAGIVSEGT